MREKMQPAGFTLLELLVVATVLSLLSVVITQVFLLVVRVNTKAEILKDIKNNGQYALDVITRLTQNSLTINTASCVEQGETPVATDSMTITNNDGYETTFACEAMDSVARIASVSAEGTSYLTNTNTTLVDPSDSTQAVCGDEAGHYALSFMCFTNAGEPATVQVAFTLRQKEEGAALIEKALSTFENTISLRN